MKHAFSLKTSRPVPRLLGPVAAALLSVSLIGCTQDEITGKEPSVTLVAPAQRHPILVSQKPTTMTVQVPSGSSGLTPKARAELLEFIQHFRAGDAGDSRLLISAPSGSANETAAMNAVSQIRGLLADSGYTDSSVSVEAFDSTEHAQPPLKVSYMRYVAEGPECGNWPTNVAHEPQNLTMANTGCANQHNFAAMIANPADLLGPRTMTARAGERRDMVWDKYQKGEITASQKNEDGKISTRNQGGN